MDKVMNEEIYSAKKKKGEGSVGGLLKREPKSERMRTVRNM